MYLQTCLSLILKHSPLEKIAEGGVQEKDLSIVMEDITKSKCTVSNK